MVFDVSLLSVEVKVVLQINPTEKLMKSFTRIKRNNNHYDVKIIKNQSKMNDYTVLFQTALPRDIPWLRASAAKMRKLPKSMEQS